MFMETSKRFGCQTTSYLPILSWNMSTKLMQTLTQKSDGNFFDKTFELHHKQCFRCVSTSTLNILLKYLYKIRFLTCIYRVSQNNLQCLTLRIARTIKAVAVKSPFCLIVSRKSLLRFWCITIRCLWNMKTAYRHFKSNKHFG